MKWQNLKKHMPVARLKVDLAYIPTGTGGNRTGWQSEGWIIDGAWSIRYVKGVCSHPPTHWRHKQENQPNRR